MLIGGPGCGVELELGPTVVEYQLPWPELFPGERYCLYRRLDHKRFAYVRHDHLEPT